MQKKAFTLIELVIGMVLIGVGLSAIIQVIQYATKVTNSTKAQVVAVNLARE
jgi:prepilin-type N-terminal cleavage/methylation domain-containing protein